MNIVCLGDSTTYGYMVGRNKVWTKILNDKFAEENKNIKFINKGINGDMISGMLVRFDMDCVKENADNVILMGGVNDIFTCKYLEEIENNFINIINKALENNIDIIAFTPIAFVKEVFTFFESNNIEEFESILKEYVNFINDYTAKNNIKSIDVYNIFVNKILKENNYYDIFFDGVHLNENGHSVFASEIYKELKKYL
ncbi:GDSL-type esterase/lipase family protein [Brachyspira hyodysenteriae]|uniref:Arylesterase n=1 Tax=Brachyspira hyodysenteriae (strain ATCC 49526 / WA1) TaxID=565034 RepID=A0A3B6VKJ0_BRAHW|nr:GDSL-type esterase/lipase family protein [Brachyspira hyodysenteriae]ACN84426.1 arylesterase [Brachyspira hyodysenteriae WA1]KLI21303.1 arylesterase [Brachyspira hyodysenteriae]KLI21640.1 arylesterase [Brachyspira hyodysenteriae]KLI33569.1 arylesterase [Brachyspira hyodysenteriae]KLI37440.1 arylesterase [Brachyspira hyodysenteriae]